HRLFYENVLAGCRRERDVGRVVLVRRRHVDRLHIRIATQRFDRSVSPRAEIRGEAARSLRARIGRGDELDARVARERWKHHREGATETRDTHTQPPISHSVSALARWLYYAQAPSWSHAAWRSRHRRPG